MAEPLRVRYVAAATLSRFLDSNAYVRCIVGPVGSGKSSACVLELLARACGQKPGKDGIRRTRFVVIRNTYRELKDTTRKTFEKWIPEQLGSWSETDFTFRMRFNDVESEVMFRALDKPQHVRKLLSLELTGAYINEVREISKNIFDVLQTRIGRYPSMDDGGPTWRGIWMDTNPWHAGHWCGDFFKEAAKVPPEILQKLRVKTPGEYAQLFRQPGGREPNAENVEFLDPGYYDRLCIGKDREWIECYVDGKEAKAAVGSIYGDLIASLEEAGGVAEFDHGRDQVFTSWDLGRSDATAIWFWRIAGRDRIDVVDYYENHLLGIKHYLDVVDARGYTYVTHWLPHDARAKTVATELSVEDQCRERWPDKVQIGPMLSVQDGIQATRWLLEGRARFHPRCKEGIAALRAYRRKYDEIAQAYLPTPVHDWASNGADAARYMSVTVRATEMLMRKPDGPPVATVADLQAIEWLRMNPNHPKAQGVAEYLESKGLYHAPKRPTLDEMWKSQGQGSGRERI